MLYDKLKHIEFAYPAFFGLLLILPLMIIWYWQKARPLQGTLLVSSVNSFGKTVSWKNIFRHSVFVFRLLAIAFLITALARPQIRDDEQLINGEGIDIVLCIDISGSMLAQDFTPNRLEAAKNVASDFIDSRPTDRIGLVIFSGESFTMCPLTADRTVLKTQLANVQRQDCWKMLQPLAPAWQPVWSASVRRSPNRK